MEFLSGYLFGKVLGAHKYILMSCSPNTYDGYGIISYEHGNASVLRCTAEQLARLNEGDDQWIDHENMISTEGGFYIGESIGDAIWNFENKSETFPELYLRKSDDSGISQFVRVYDMTIEQINALIGEDALKSLYYYDEANDAFTHVCGDSYGMSQN
jgi:hypothetical protein